MRLKVYSAQILGGRSSQEDRLVVQSTKSGTLLAVMDGHGGASTADEVKNKLGAAWRAARSRKVEDRIKQAFHFLHGWTAKGISGSTLSMVWIPRGSRNAYVGVLGDSPVAIQDAFGKIWIAPEHNAATNYEDRKKAVSLGAGYACGYIEYGDFCLQLTRALGDLNFDPVLDREPEVFKVGIDLGTVILLASDGIFAHHGVKVAEDYKPLFSIANVNGNVAEELVKQALHGGSMDNISAIICKVLK